MLSKEQLEMRYYAEESQDRITPCEVRPVTSHVSQALTQPSLSFLVRRPYFTTIRYPVSGTMLRNFVTYDRDLLMSFLHTCTHVLLAPPPIFFNSVMDCNAI
jgi:hypothetical protein